MMKLLTPIVLIALAIGLFFTFTDARYESAQAVAGEVAEYDEVLEKTRELAMVRDELLTEYNAFDQEALERLEKLLPDNVENVKLVMEIDGIANQYGMTIRDVTIVEETTEDDTIAEEVRTNRAQLSLEFTVGASYEDFMLFLADLENSLRIVDVQSILVENSEVDFHDFTVGVNTYWLGGNI